MIRPSIVGVPVLTLALCCGALPAAAQPQTIAPAPPAAELSADDLLARARTALARERRPESERESWEIRASGLSGTQETVRRGDDFRIETLLGPFHTSRGTAKGKRWHQNDNGQTIVERDEPSQVEHVLTQSVERVREPLDAWELTTTFASGHVTREYFDPRTYYRVRVDRSIAGIDSHTIYDDYRTDARGHTRYWHYSGATDRPVAGNEYDYRLVRDDPNADVAQDDVDLPHDRRELAEFPAGADTVRLPARIIDDRVYVTVTIGGRGLDFVLDTGSSSINLDPTVAKQLGLMPVGHATETVAGSFATGRSTVPLMQIGDLTMRDVVVRMSPVAPESRPGLRVVGLLGFDFIDSVGLKIDYDAGTVDALRAGSWQPPAGAVALDVSLNTSTPVARATIGDAAGDDFVIDTGAAFSFVLFQRFLRAHPDAIEPDSIAGHIRNLSGVGGTVEYRNVSSKRVSFGTYTFDDANGIETLSPNAFGLDTEDGLIGGDLLKRFTLYTDYASSKLYLTPAGRSAGAKTARGERNAGFR